MLLIILLLGGWAYILYHKLPLKCPPAFPVNNPHLDIRPPLACLMKWFGFIMIFWLKSTMLITTSDCIFKYYLTFFFSKLLCLCIFIDSQFIRKWKCSYFKLSRSHSLVVLPRTCMLFYVYISPWVTIVATRFNIKTLLYRCCH